MPDAPKPDAAKASPAAAQIDLKDGVTKYLAESRAQIEIQGRDGQPRGGWDKPKATAELEALAKAGTFMDLFRWQSGGPVENGHVLAERIMTGGGAVEAQGTLANGTWTVVLKRPLKPGQPGDIAIEPGKAYTVGIAIHDDHANARFHHVSLEYRLGLDSADAEINVKKR